MAIVGREREIQELRTLLDRAGCAVLCGPAGIGKSALARCIEPARWVDLEEVATADALIAGVAAALGCPVGNDAAVLEALSGAPLVVLDAAEGVDEPLAERFEAWRARARLLVTSRHRPPLEAPVVELGPISDEEGARLLRSRVRSARQAQSLDEGELRELCRAVDGVPLALELAAPWLSLYAPAQVRERALRDLHDPGRPRRQQLVDAIEKGVEDLAEAGRRALAAAAILPGPFRTERLQLLLDAPVEGALLELLDAALLFPLAGVPPRFRVLAPVREVALARLGPAERERLLERLGAVLDIDEEVDRPTLERLLEASDPAVRLRAAIALAAVERRTGPMEATAGRDPVVAEGCGPRELQVRWGLDAAAAALHVGQIGAAERALVRIEPILTESERPEWLSLRALWHLNRGRSDDALELALAAEAAGSDPWLSFRVGGVRFHRGELPEAVDAFRRGREVPDPFRRAQATYALCAAMREGAAPSADVLAELVAAEGLIALRTAPWLVPRFRMVRGTLLADLGRIDEARAAIGDSVEGLLAIGEPDSALEQWLYVQSLDFLEGRVPVQILGPPRCEPGRALPVLELWRAVVLAAQGTFDEARALGAGALGRLREARAGRLSELGTALAVALCPREPGFAATVLDQLPADALTAFARALVAGERPRPGPRIEEQLLAALSELAGRRVRVRPDGTAFVGPDGERVDLGRRRVLARVLHALAASPGPVDVDGICAVAWPGETLVGDSGTRRVHVAISSLRGMGLRDAIVTRTDADGTTRWELVALRSDGV